jgi:TatA/E family protein of Tat protein translocase
VDILSPAKLLVILVVAVVVLGPDKLPKVAKQIGSLWGDFRKFRERLESDVRGSFPDLPSSATISHAVRSPLSFLDNLADTHSTAGTSSTADTSSTNGTSSTENGATSAPANGVEQPDVHGDQVQPSSEVNRPAGSVQVAGEGPGVLIGDPGVIAHQVRSSGRELPDDPGMN